MVATNTAPYKIKSGNQPYIMNLIKRYKEIVFLLCVAFVVGLASYDLFGDQRQNSGMVNSGTTLAPANFSGRITCEVPIPSVRPKKAVQKADTLSEKLQKKQTSEKPSASNN